MIRVGLTQAQADAVAKPSRYKFELNGTITVFDGTDYITPAIREIATFDFINRFLPAERAACLALAYSGTGNTTAADILLQTQSASVVNLDGDKTISSMAFWVVQSCITAARSLTILS